MVVGKFLCREVCRERIPPRDAQRAEEVERRTQLIMPDLERYRGGRKRLCLWEVERPEAVEPFPIQRLGIHCPPVSWWPGGTNESKVRGTMKKICETIRVAVGYALAALTLIALVLWSAVLVLAPFALLRVIVGVLV